MNKTNINDRSLMIINDWSSFHANDCVFSRNEQQKVYLHNVPQKCLKTIMHLKTVKTVKSKIPSILWVTITKKPYQDNF